MIDPATLFRQRVTVVEPVKEYRCPICSRRSRNREGICGPCQRINARDVTRLTTDDLVRLQASCRLELQRRRSQIEAALREDDR